MRKLPIGVQSFDEIRSGDYIYVDKTRYVLDLIESGKYYFLSRPRRFGKSLLVDTMRCLFEGRKELFEGLYIYDKWDWEEKFSVIRVSFGSYGLSEDLGLEDYIRLRLNEIAKDNNVYLESKVYYEMFNELIMKLSRSGRVVVLVDEYDKPILDKIEDKEEAIKRREILKSFYQVMKDRDRELGFVFLTGVSKFSKVSIFSGLNNLRDITISERYSAFCGYTQEELEENFEEYLGGVDKREMSMWYNGYNWTGEKVYNPYDVLLFFADGGKYRSYWFESGTPGFLIKELMEKRFYLPEIERIEAGEEILSSFDVGDIHPVALLFQTGYLTIKEEQRLGEMIGYILSYPNLEVKMALNSHILKDYTKVIEKDALRMETYRSLQRGDIEKVVVLMKRLLSSIPNDWYRKNKLHEYEGFYSSVFYSVFQSLGLECVGEDVTNRGRIDLSVKIGGYVYVFEFKVVEEDEDGKRSALEQIMEKRYWEKYEGIGKKIVLVGIEFSKENKNIIKSEHKIIN
ncbi:MAG: ATPase AAA [Bacteroidia bacterium]|nr:MAG: ATPase AAA [Bacteroidia bacterium]